MQEEWVFGIIIAQALSWVGMFVLKIIDWLWGGKDKVINDIHTIKESVLLAMNDISYLKKNAVTSESVRDTVRKELDYRYDVSRKQRHGS